jgi:hypothetical protein
MKTKTERVTVALERKQFRLLRKAAADRHCGNGVILRQALDLFFSRESQVTNPAS